MRASAYSPWLSGQVAEPFQHYCGIAGILQRRLFLEGLIIGLFGLGVLALLCEHKTQFAEQVCMRAKQDVVVWLLFK